jgi:cell division protein FtsI (penicillin-binding protein 3)
MNKEQKGFAVRLYIFAIPVMLVLFFIFGKLFWLSIFEGPEIREKSHAQVVKEFVVEAERGKIYSADGKLLATSMPVFDVFMDPVAPTDADFEQHVKGLSRALALLSNAHTQAGWESHLRECRRNGIRYVKIQKDVTFSDLQSIKQFPMFNLGRFKGGLIYEQKNFRKNPLGAIAERTIGYDRETGEQSGIEGAFSSYLEGKDGRRWKQKIAQGYWKPLNDFSEIEPENGMDVVTTLMSHLQDVAHDQLLQTLRKYEADHGTVVLMEVKTGKIRAIANLGKNPRTGDYTELRNYAVWEASEPGSTFKLAVLMVGLEDGVIDTSDIVDTGDGIYKLFDKEIRDSNVKYGKGGYGPISIAHAFRVSSNVGMVKAMYPHYKNQPEKFVDRLYKLGFDQPLGLRIKGEGTPSIPRPGDARWSGLSLPWMCFGYEVALTPLQQLTFYNAVANNGVMVKPQFVEEVKQRGRSMRKFNTEVMQSAICSKATIGKLQGLLAGVVADGTAKSIKSDRLQLAGKTGTSRMNYWKAGAPEYQSSFAGYFPVDDPQYSCIVIIHKPNTAIGYYGSDVAAPIFKKLAEEAYAYQPVAFEAKEPIIKNNQKTQLHTAAEILANGAMPNLKGLAGRDVVALLENHGVALHIVGNGRVRSQSVSPGTPLNKRVKISIELG